MSEERRLSLGGPTVRVAACVLLLALCASLAWAQPPGGGTSGGPLAPARDGAAAREALWLVISLSGAHDDTVGGADRGIDVDSRLAAGGTFSVAESRLTYSRRGRRTSFEGVAASTAFAARDELLGASHTAAVGIERSLSPRTSMRVRASAGVAPFYAPSTFPAASQSGLADPRLFNRDHAVADDPLVYYGAGTNLVTSLTSRSTLTVDYTAQYTRQDRRGDLLEQRVGARFGRRMTRYSSLHLAVRARQGDHQLTEGRRPVRAYDIDLGFGRDWPVSPSRRAAVTFSLGTSVVDDGGRRSYRLAGSAALSRQMSQSWTAHLGYTRGTHFIEGFQRPLFADSATVAVSGLLSRRLSLQTSVGLARGQVGVAGPAGRNDDYEAYSGSAGLSFAVTRGVAVYGQYFYYHYILRDEARPPGLDPGALDRRGMRVGLTLGIPLIERGGAQ